MYRDNLQLQLLVSALFALGLLLAMLIVTGDARVATPVALAWEATMIALMYLDRRR